MNYAKGKRAFGFSDRSGFRYPINELVEEIRNGSKTGVLVGRDEIDPDHPQNFLGRVRIHDPQALKTTRPDTYVESLFGFDPVGNPAQYLVANIGKVTVSIT
jgi:hypothetical protein